MSSDPPSATADSSAYVAGLEARLEDLDELERRIVDAEQRLAAVPELKLKIKDLEYQLAAANKDAAKAEQTAQELDQMLMYGRRMLRFVRPLIKPLRDARRRLRS